MSPDSFYVDAPARRREAAMLRRGVSLIEVAGVMAASALLMTATIAVAIAIQRADRARLTAADDERGLEQFVDVLRRDLHAAPACSWQAADGALRLETSDQRRLEFIPGAAGPWQRRVIDASASGGESSAAFRLSSNLSWRIVPATAKAGDLLRVEFFQSTSGAEDSGDRQLRDAPVASLTATVGRDERLLQ